MDNFNWIPPKSRSRKDRDQVSTRVFTDSKELFEAIAESRGLSLSEFLAEVLDKYADECTRHFTAIRAKVEKPMLDGKLEQSMERLGITREDLWVALWLEKRDSDREVKVAKLRKDLELQRTKKPG